MTTYQFKIILKGIEPLIWRSFQVDSDITFHKLHKIIQAVMGWQDYHEYEFTVRKKRVAKNAKLAEHVFIEGLKFTYTYDFGDGWLHELKLEKIISAEESLLYPICLKGARACPPEDCGGEWGYKSLLEIINNPEDEQYEEMTDWLGEDFNLEEFNIDSVNAKLKKIQNKKRTLKQDSKL